MDMYLVVVRPFAGFARGDVVTDANRINEILGNEHASGVVRVLAQGADGTLSSAAMKEG